MAASMAETGLRFGPFVLDPRRAMLRREGKDVAVGARGVALLEALVEADGEVVTREALVERAWPGAIVEDGNLTVQIATLRKVLGTRPDGREWIATVPRVGYRLIAAADAAAPATMMPTIAVLPFANFSSDPGQGYFADGLVEDLITALSRFRTFAVVARNSSFAYKDRAVDVREVGRELGVRYLLEGSVRQTADQIRVSAQLIDATSGLHVWAENFDGARTDVLDLQDRIVERVVIAVEPQIRRAEIARLRRKRPENLDAYELYLQALPLVQGPHRHGYSEAIALLERAIALDPGFAPAFVVKGWAHGKRIWTGTTPPGVDDSRIGLELVERALALDPNDAVILAIAGTELVFKESTERGLACHRRALALNPNSFIVLNVSGFGHRRAGLFDEAIEYHARAMRLNPERSELKWSLLGTGHAHMGAGRIEEALTWGLRASECDRDLHQAYLLIASALGHLGRRQDAAAALADAMKLRPNLTLGDLMAPGGGVAEPDRMYVEGLAAAGLR